MDDEINEILRAFHFETFRAGVCYERDEWPHTDEEWANLNRDIQSEAVGEHFDGWAPEMLEKLSRALTKVEDTE